MTDPALLAATALAPLFRSRALSPVEVTEACLARIERLDPQVNAFVLVDRPAALDAARAAEQRWREGRALGPLDGVPAAIKDIILTRGWPTLRGSLTIDAAGPWDEDAPATARLREAGCVLIGKTTTPEFGHKGVTASRRHGLTRNPWSLGHHAGGSSGGAAVAPALGMGALHLGTDGAGSVRIPASLCGIFGLKPSFGRVPAYPPSPFALVAHLGPMTRSVGDAALMLNALARPDARDWYSLPPGAEDFMVGLEGGVRGLRVAYAPTLNGAAVDPEVQRLVALGVQRFAEAGAVVEMVTLDLPGAAAIEQAIWTIAAAVLVEGIDPARRELLEPSLLAQAETGRCHAVLDYHRLLGQRAVLGRQMRLFHQDWDLLVTPTLPCAAFPVEQDHPGPASPTAWLDWLPFTYPFNLTQQPAATIPCGLTSAGLPVGLQIVGPMFGDALVLRAARAFEVLQPIPLPPLAAA